MGALPDYFDPSKGSSWTPANPVTADQLDIANGLNVGAISQQQRLANALMSQNGTGMEAQAAALQGQGNVLGQQQALANQLGLMSQGGGPNPAQAALNQNTAANVANQAALMAGQRGASANPALMARQIANQGAATQQQAVGQGATLQAQQQIAAQNALGQQQQAMLGNLAHQGALGGQMISQGQQGVGALGQMTGANQNSIFGANSAANDQKAKIAAGVNAGQGSAVNNLFGGALSGMGGAMAAMMAEGGEVPTSAQRFGKFLGDMGNQFSGGQQQGGGNGLMGGLMKYISSQNSLSNPASSSLSSGQSMENAMYSPQERLGSGMEMQRAMGGGALQGVADIYHGNAFSRGGNVGASLKKGGAVPGKAKVSGDSEVNDTVQAKLSPGEVVLPRSVMQSKDPVSAAAQFVAALQNKKGSGQKEEGEFKQALHRAIQGRKSK